MATHLTPDEMKAFVRQHFEDFVNNKKAEVIRHNMTPDFYDHDGPGGKAAGVEEDENMMRAMYNLMPGIQKQTTVEGVFLMAASPSHHGQAHRVPGWARSAS